MAQIGLDLEIGVEAEGERFAVLQRAAEFAVQRLVGQIGDMGGHAGNGEALMRVLAGVQIAAAAPVRIGHDRLAANFVESDVLRGMARAGGDRDCREQTLRKARRPLQHLHAAHGTADRGKKRLDAEMVEQHGLGAHHVADGDDRQVERIRLGRLRIDRRRAGRAHAAAKHIGADDKIAVGVDRPAGPDHQ